MVSSLDAGLVDVQDGAVHTRRIGGCLGLQSLCRITGQVSATHNIYYQGFKKIIIA